MKTTNAQLSIGTGGGTLLSVLAQLGMHDMVRTAALAAIGAVVAIPAPFVGPLFGALAGAAVGFLSAKRRG